MQEVGVRSNVFTNRRTFWTIPVLGKIFPEMQNMICLWLHPLLGRINYLLFCSGDSALSNGSCCLAGCFFPQIHFSKTMTRLLPFPLFSWFILEFLIFGLSNFLFKDNGVRLSTQACLALFAQQTDFASPIGFFPWLFFSSVVSQTRVEFMRIHVPSYFSYIFIPGF